MLTWVLGSSGFFLGHLGLFYRVSFFAVERCGGDGGRKGGWFLQMGALS
jgi:hypothetical protein